MMLEGKNFTIDPNELSLGLWEVNKAIPEPGEGFHRMRGIRVMRGDDPKDCLFDMGRVKYWGGVEEFYLYGGVVRDVWGERHMAPMNLDKRNVASGGYEPIHSVAELMHMAEQKHEQAKDAAQLSNLDLIEPKMSVEQIASHFEDQSAWSKARSTFGYGGQKVRNL